MNQIYGVFLVQNGLKHFSHVHIPIAFFTKKDTAENYMSLRKESFPQENTVMEAWIVDDSSILNEIFLNQRIKTNDFT